MVGHISTPHFTNVCDVAVENGRVVWCREPSRVSALPEPPRLDARSLGHRGHLVHTTSGSTASWPNQVPKPQSLPGHHVLAPDELRLAADALRDQRIPLLDCEQRRD